MGGALWTVMEEVFVSLKQAANEALIAQNQMTKEFGLTPARFDVLFALKEFSDELPTMTMTQYELRDMFRVTAPVISRMLRSLEKLGLVRRGPRTRKYRTSRLVHLTERGRALIKRAAKRIVFNGRVRRLASRALRRGSRSNDEHRRDLLGGLLSTLTTFLHLRRCPPTPIALSWEPEDT